MATKHRIIVLREAEVPAANAWLDRHPELDLRGGGAQSFTTPVALESDAVPRWPPRGRILSWGLSDDDYAILKTKFLNLGWKANSTDANNIVSWYDADDFSEEQVLADLTRKPGALRYVSDGEKS